MAWRIGEFIERGWVDNRVRGLVRAELKLRGQEEPIVLTLEGNAWRDLAGRRATFACKALEPPQDIVEEFPRRHGGHVGDVSAAQPRRIPIGWPDVEISYPNLPPTEWRNIVYLEWFTAHNGRCVAEIVPERLTLSEPAWEMTEAEETAQHESAAAQLDAFMASAADSFQTENERLRTQEDEVFDKGARDGDSLSEDDWEALLKINDARIDRIMEIYESCRDKMDPAEIFERLHAEAEPPEEHPFGDLIAAAEQEAAEAVADPADALAEPDSPLHTAANKVRALVADEGIRETLKAAACDPAGLWGELLNVYVKSSVVADLALGDVHDPAHLLALARRELARANSVLGALEPLSAEPRVPELRAAVMGVRSELVALRGQLRNPQ